MVEPVETTPPRWSSAGVETHGRLVPRLGRAGSENFSKKFPGALWRTPFSGPECRWSVLELGHDREPRRPRHRRRGARRPVREDRSPADAGGGPRSCRRRWPGRRCTRSTRSRRRPRCGTTARPGCRSPDPAHPWSRSSRSPSSPPRSGCPTEAGKAYLGEAVELRYRLEPGLVPGDQGRPARLAGPPGRPRDHASCRWRPPRTSTATSPTSRTRSAPPSSTGSSRRRSGGSCPRRPNAAAARPPTAGPSPSTRGNPRCAGTSTVYGELDLADALDLDAAVAAGAQALKDLGSTDTLDVRRATAVGDLARRQLTLDLNPDQRRRARRRTATRADGDPTVGRRPRPPQPPRGRPASRVRWCCTCTSPTPPWSPAPRWPGEFGRVENTRGPVHAEQIRQWCGNPDAQITVQPVLDLNEHIDVEAYEIRGRLREQTILTHPTCVFPWCTQTRPRPGARRARRRLRPPGPLRQGPAQLLLQRRPVVPAASPGQDPRRLDLHRPGTRDLCVDQPARVPVPARPPRHPRRVPRPAPPPAGPLHPPPGRLTPPPRTPPDHHRRGHRHVRSEPDRVRQVHRGPRSKRRPHRVAAGPAGGRVARTCDLTGLGRLGRRGVTPRPPTGRARPHRRAFGRRGPSGHVIGRRARPWRRVDRRGPQRSLPGLDRLDRWRVVPAVRSWSTDPTGGDGLDRRMAARSDDLTGPRQARPADRHPHQWAHRFSTSSTSADQGRAGRPLLNLFPRGVGEYCYAWRDRKR